MTEILAGLEGTQQTEIEQDWPALWARAEQKPPSGDNWRNWLLIGGRGAGKTRAGAEWVKACATGLGLPAGASARHIALVAPNFDEVRIVMIEGVSGLLAIHENSWRPIFEPSKRQLTWPNGAVAQVFSAEEPESLRGPQFDLAWCDELAKWKYADAVWDMLQFSLRLGENPKVMVTITPRPIALLKRMIGDPASIVAHAPTGRNEGFLSPAFLDEMTERYGGTRLGRQELDGELIDDDPDALVTALMGAFIRHGVATAPAK
jgi:phage terminase large subunit-like protein